MKVVYCAVSGVALIYDRNKCWAVFADKRETREEFAPQMFNINHMDSFTENLNSSINFPFLQIKEKIKKSMKFTKQLLV